MIDFSQLAKWAEQLLWFLTAIAGGVAIYRFVMLTTKPMESAPLFSAEAIGICALVIIPYVLARAVQQFRRSCIDPA